MLLKSLVNCCFITTKTKVWWETKIHYDAIRSMAIMLRQTATKKILDYRKFTTIWYGTEESRMNSCKIYCYSGFGFMFSPSSNIRLTCIHDVKCAKLILWHIGKDVQKAVHTKAKKQTILFVQYITVIAKLPCWAWPLFHHYHDQDGVKCVLPMPCMINASS